MTSILAQRPTTERSFERLYRAHLQDVYRYSLMLLRNRADAEDVAQTTFMKAYRAILRGDRPRHPRRWLIAIAHNTCCTRARDESRRPREVSFDETLAEPTAGEESDVDVGELVRALGALADNQRSALVMRELEGRSYAEIARALGVSGSAVETLLFRARRALREQLEGSLTCGEAEHALSLQLDNRLGVDERKRLRAHLRECGECASLARRQRARRAAVRSLGPFPLPASLASGAGIGTGSGVAVKVAALLAAGVAATGVSSGDGAVATAPEQDTRPAALVAAAPSTTASPRAAVAPPRAGTKTSARRPSLRARTILADAAPPAAPPVRAPAPRTPSPSSAPAPAPTAAPAAAPSVGAVEATTPEVTLTAAETTVTVPPVTVTVPALPVEVPLPPPPPPAEVPPLPLP